VGCFGIGVRIVIRWGADRCGEDRRLRGSQLGDVLLEVRLRRGGDAIGATTEVDRIEVGGHDVVFGPLVAHLGGNGQFGELALVRVLVADEGVLHVLLGDRRPAAGILAVGQAADDGAAEAADREAGIAAELAVLGGDDGVLQRLGDVGDLDVGAPHAMRFCLDTVFCSRAAASDLLDAEPDLLLELGVSPLCEPFALLICCLSVCRAARRRQTRQDAVGARIT